MSKKLSLLFTLMLLPLIASAYTFEIDGIYYKLKVTGTTKTAAVTYRDQNYNSYSGSVTIPTSITYSDETYIVTEIDWYAFYGCTGLTSIEIPSSVTIIGSYAFYSCTGLTSIEIPNSVTFIGDRAFSGCSGLTSIEIPSSVTSIGSYVFYGCTGLTSMEIPTSVTTIFDRAFQGCSSLTSIEIPSSVTSIGNNAFSGCSGLTSIEIPSSITIIGSYAFSNCTGLTSVHITDLSAWCKISFNYQESNPLWYAKHLFMDGKEITDLVIPNSVTSIGSYAFSGCSSLTSVTIPNSVTSIGNGAFFDCSGLTSVEIPNSVTSIGRWAFSSCTSLSSLFIPQSIYSIDESAFLNCTGLESIVVDLGNPKYDSRDNCNAIIETATNKLIVGSRNTIIPQSVTDYGQYGLANCVKLTLPAGMDEIPINYLINCKNLESITIPNSIKKIYDHSFDGCSSLKTIIIEDGTEELLFDPLYTYPQWFKDCPIDSIYLGRVIRPKYTEYEYLPFRELSTLRTVVFGDNIIDIPSSFFSGCENLCSVRLSENIKSIGHSAFASCVNIQHINFNSQLETIGQYAFSYSNLNKIVIPSSVKSIGENAFGCSHLSCLIFEDGDEDVLLDGRDNMFWGNTIDSLYWGRNGPKINFRKIKHITLADVNIKSFGGITCDSVCVISIKAGKEALSISLFRKDVIIDSVYCNRVLDVNASGNHPLYLANSMFKLEIGKELTCIGDNMFYGCKIPSLFIPNNIKHISPTAFNNCNILSSVLIEDSTEPLDFGEGNNFYGCQLRDVYLGRNMEFSTNSPFNGNKEGIQKLTFGSNVTEIPDNTFAGLKNVKELTLPKNLKKVGSMAFYGCEGLTELTIPGSVTEIGQQAFDLCRNLKTLRLDDGKELLKFTAEPNYLNNAFQNSPLEEVYIGRDFSFNNSSPLAIFETMKSLTFGEEVLSIQARSFIGCPNLKDVTSYSKVVPTTNDIVFTPSYQTNATLHVPYALYDEYKVANVWKDFGTIVNFEGLYNLVYNVDGEEYKKYVVEQGTTITPETAPYKEGYTFSGWSEIPATMPAHDVTVTGTFTSSTGIEQIMSNVNSGAMIFNIDGKQLSRPRRGLNIVRMSDGTTKKVVVK